VGQGPLPQTYHSKWDQHRPPDQEKKVDEAFYKQLKVASESQALVLMGDFNHPDISWEDHTARQARSRGSCRA